MRPQAKQVVGIDISKMKIDATICIVNDQGKRSYITTESYDNNKRGFRKLLSCVRKHCSKSVYTQYVMEATGVYYEELAYFLYDLKQNVVVVLANKVKNYARCLNVKTKTDKIDSHIISQMGSEQDLVLWQPSKPIYRNLRSLTRMHQNLKNQLLVFNNQQEALEHSYNEGLEFIIKSTKKLIVAIEKQIEQCIAELRRVVASDEYISQRVANIETIKGVGFLTAVIVISETLGFKNISNCKQLTSYAGLDVVERQSGSSVKGRSRISKKGNSRIRGALYVPAMSASTCNSKLKEFYERINRGKTAKKPGIIAIQRKLLILIYTLWKKNEPARV